MIIKRFYTFFFVCVLSTLAHAEEHGHTDVEAEVALPVNINTADQETLAATLSGVGEKKAEAIIMYREENGPFTSVLDLINVKGIGPAILEKNVDLIMIEDETDETMVE